MPPPPRIEFSTILQQALLLRRFAFFRYCYHIRMCMMHGICEERYMVFDLDMIRRTYGKIPGAR